MTQITKRMPKRKTKIVATIGPASQSAEVIRGLIEAGMDTARLNFSHGTYEGHLAVLKTIREESQRAGRYIAVLQDLCGPKVRITDIKDGSTVLSDGGIVRIRRFDGALGSSEDLFVEVFDPVKVIDVGERVLLSDGLIELTAESTCPDYVECRVKAGGELRGRSGIVLPESKLDLPCLTTKDEEDMKWGVENEVDYVALSFVASAQDVVRLRNLIRSLGADIPIVSKIERAKSLDHIPQIVGVSDAVMVARGDLGLEVPLEKVPGTQRLIIETANHRGTPVITATQMLVSMVHKVRPTRAEVTDVSTAVRDGTDCVMLSEETAVGKHPAEVVRVLTRILEAAEHEVHILRQPPRFKGSDEDPVADSICYAANGAADKISASAILACTESGYTARLMAKYRPEQPLFGPSPTEKALRRMAIYWGVEPVAVERKSLDSTEDQITAAMSAVRDGYGLKPGSRVVITAGLRSGVTRTTNLIQIREIPRQA